MAKNKLILPVAAILLGSVACSHFSDSHGQRKIASEYGPKGRLEPGGHYDGPDVGPGRDQGRRPPQAFTYCERYKNDTAQHVLACTFAVDEATRFSERVAGGHGRVEGYQRGFIWGMRKMSDVYDNDPSAMLDGERNVDTYSSYWASATNDGTTRGVRDGENLGSSEARNRFYSAVGSQKIPSADVNVPVTSYNGEVGASARYVGGVPSIEDVLRANPDLGEIPIYRGLDRTMGDFNDHRAGDIWNSDGAYRHEVDRWINGNEALQAWLKMRGPGRDRYDRLNSQQRVSFAKSKKSRSIASEPTPGSRPNPGGGGQRPGGPGGGGTPPQPTATPVPTQTPVIISTPTPGVTPVVVATPAPVDYQAIFREAFVVAYQQYAPYHYYRAFNDNIDDGQREGEVRGEKIGKIIAYKKGLLLAFDRKYQDLSRSAYVYNFGLKYKTSFGSTYNFYKDNSILTLNFIDLVGGDDDGVIQPGEDFAVRFKVTNAGGKSASLQYTVAGDIQNAQKFSETIPGLAANTYISGNIAQIDPRLENDANASIQLIVNEMKESLSREVKRPLQISGIDRTVAEIEGTGLFSVTLVNIATQPLAGKISLELKLNGQVVKTVIGEKMNPGNKQSLALDFKGIDPLKLIANSMPVEIVVKYNESVFLNKAFSVGGSRDLNLYGAYFDRLVNETGYVPEGINVADRIAEVRKILLDSNISEVGDQKDASGNIYKENPSRTVPGIILSAKQARAAQSARALGEYSSLAKAMVKEAKTLKSFLGIHPKRTAYLKILSDIAGQELK